MTTQPIPFAPAQESGLEPLAGAQPLAENVIIDARGAVRKRPGIAPYFSSGAATVVDAGGIGHIHIAETGRVFALSNGVSSRYVYTTSATGATRLNGTVTGTKRPVVAESQGYLFFAAGARIEKHQIGSSQLVALGGTPPLTTHVAMHYGRLIALDLDDTNRIHYSAPQAGFGIDGFELWNGDDLSDSGPFALTQRPDETRALAENTNELFGFGARTLQVLSPDAQTVLVPSATREVGCSAAYSIVKDDQSFAWLDDRRRIVRSDARDFTPLSAQIQADLDTVPDVSDAFGYRVTEGELDALVWTFPADERTFAYLRGRGWSQWSGWDPNTSNRSALKVTAAATSPTDGRVIVGLSDGRMGVYSRDAGDDLGDEFRASITTGFIDRGTLATKRCNRVLLALRRGRDSSATDIPKALLRWRDDEGPWGQPLEVSLGVLPERGIVVPFDSLGTYRKRQWQFSFLSGVGLELAAVTEDFTVQEI